MGDYDANNRWFLRITKKRGKLTLDEIKQICREWGFDYYLLFLDCFHSEYDEQCFGDTGQAQGDIAEVYNADILNRKPNWDEQK